jgi:hypothetical protein
MDQEAAIREGGAGIVSKPNVTGVGLGKRNGKPVIKVFVTRKLSKSELRASDLVPKKVAGYPTDVEEDEPGRRAAANLLTRDEARRIALNIAKIPAYRRSGATS